VDLHTGAMLGVNVYPADQGDTAGLADTLTTVQDNLASLGDQAPELLCVVTDKGYHKAELIKEINTDQQVTTYIPERESKSRRRWHGDLEAYRQFHANRRRTRGNEGKRLSRLRDELVERSFALLKRTGGLARTTLRGLANVNKRYLIHAAAYNLGLVMRAIFGHGTPKGMAEALARLLTVLLAPILLIFALLMPDFRPWRPTAIALPGFAVVGIRDDSARPNR
jgi:transposase